MVTRHQSLTDQKIKVKHSNYRESHSLPKEESDNVDILDSIFPEDAEYESEQPQGQHFNVLTEGSASGPQVYEDRQGPSVTHDATVHEPRKSAQPDAISVLWHELLTPLTVIKGYVSTLLELNSVITEEQKEQYIRGIESASNRVIRLLENLRDITRLEETNSMTAQLVSLHDLLLTVISEMQSQTTNHVIKLHPTGRLPLIRVDPEKIEQVISNLLVNAIKYSPQGGDIEAEVHLTQNQPELRRMFGDAPPVKLPCLIVSISDHGIGIPGAEQERIFEKFYQVKNKLTRTTQGAGLGLYICKIIVEAHGGHIWVRNRLQGGSIFSFSLPMG